MRALGAAEAAQRRGDTHRGESDVYRDVECTIGVTMPSDSVFARIPHYIHSNRWRAGYLAAGIGVVILAAIIQGASTAHTAINIAALIGGATLGSLMLKTVDTIGESPVQKVALLVLSTLTVAILIAKITVHTEPPLTTNSVTLFALSWFAWMSEGIPSDDA